MRARYAREGYPESRIPYLQQVLASDPLNLAAMKQMADLYQQTPQWQLYAQALRKFSEMTEDPASAPRCACDSASCRKSSSTRPRPR